MPKMRLTTGGESPIGLWTARYRQGIRYGIWRSPAIRLRPWPGGYLMRLTRLQV